MVAGSWCTFEKAGSGTRILHEVQGALRERDLNLLLTEAADDVGQDGVDNPTPDGWLEDPDLKIELEG